MEDLPPPLSLVVECFVASDIWDSLCSSQPKLKEYAALCSEEKARVWNSEVPRAQGHSLGNTGVGPCTEASVLLGIKSCSWDHVAFRVPSSCELSAKL